MINLSNKKKRRPRSGASEDQDLADKVKELRTGLGLVQAEFAERLGVSRTQVAEWENGAKERPSVERLLLMAKLAPDSEARMWFWAKAGVNLDALKADFREDLRLRTEFWKPGQVLRVPIVSELSVGPQGELLETEDGSLTLPAERFPYLASISCFKYAKRLPWVLNDGDLVIVDRSVTDPQKLRQKMTAVFLDIVPFDESLLSSNPAFLKMRLGGGKTHGVLDPAVYRRIDEWVRQFRPEDIASIGRERLFTFVAEAIRPGFLVGWLDVKYASNEQHKQWRPEGDPWYLVLRIQSHLSRLLRELPLSKSQTSGNPYIDYSTPLAPLLSKGVRIIGEVKGWIGAPPTSSLNEARNA